MLTTPRVQVPLARRAAGAPALGSTRLVIGRRLLSLAEAPAAALSDVSAREVEQAPGSQDRNQEQSTQSPDQDQLARTMARPHAIWLKPR